MSTPKAGRVLFVTGTDTGVGKTLLTALLLAHLRQNGHKALAIKPFCSGARADALLLQRIQDKELAIEDISPFYFPEPVAPLVAIRLHRRSISLRQVVAYVEGMARKCDCLLVEGSGGLLVPLAEGFMVLDLIVRLGCEAIIVSRNKLGTINHTLLTVRALQTARVADYKVVLMDAAKRDYSGASNARVIREEIAPKSLILLPFLRLRGPRCAAVKENARFLKKHLAQILG